MINHNQNIGHSLIHLFVYYLFLIRYLHVHVVFILARIETLYRLANKVHPFDPPFSRLLSKSYSYVGSLHPPTPLYRFANNFHFSLDPPWRVSQNVLGYVFMPLAWVMGVEWEMCRTVGQLIGLKIVVNEFYAYSELSLLIEEGAISVSYL